MGNSLLSLTLMFWCVVQLICHSSAPPEVRTGLGGSAVLEGFFMLVSGRDRCFGLAGALVGDFVRACGLRAFDRAFAMRFASVVR